ncbi:glycine/D-amino acid oxidase [Longilinea arvoryzae]|uniref:Glycine/D-amino acid oxidase n=1 Tax=Longilinea arvoryzae TaxID=360412 RepID=A0A0S7BAX2_9CHLR|nr:FAD-binding oxidoreductase [Longilinea arvoryzae]GAP14860.1 glycine/D-amino acid oxidase [Longilinea arvoryzae]
MTANPISHYDVIIIGSGSTGTPTALSMAKAGLKVLVLDRCPSVGQESNKKAIGGIRATHSDPAKIRLCLRSIEIFSTWKETCGDDIEWYQGGYMYPVYREAEEKTLKELLAKQKAYGLNIDWLDARQMLEVTPDLNPDHLLGGTFSPKDGSASPLLASHAFYHQALLHGVEFRFNEPVEEIVLNGGRVAAVRTNHATYGADVVVNAAGAWANEIGKLVGLDIPVHPDCHEAAITEPVAHFLDPMIVDIRPAPGSANYYFYQHLTGQIIFCITPSPNIWGYDTRETSSYLPMVSRRMVEIMPRLKNIRVRRTWRGLYPMTPDATPIVGWSKEVPGFMLAVGLCGQGFMLGPSVGELVSRLVTNQTVPEDAETLEIVSPYRKFGGPEKLQ